MNESKEFPDLDAFDEETDRLEEQVVERLKFAEETRKRLTNGKDKELTKSQSGLKFGTEPIWAEFGTNLQVPECQNTLIKQSILSGAAGTRTQNQQIMSLLL
jgi:hypothetical protein